MLNHSEDDEYRGSNEKSNFYTPIKNKNNEWRLTATCGERGELVRNLFDSNKKSAVSNDGLSLVMPCFDEKLVK